jgi:hypothetical protein
MRSITHNEWACRFDSPDDCVHKCPQCGAEHDCGNGTRCLAPKDMPCSKQCERILDDRIAKMEAQRDEEGDEE